MTSGSDGSNTRTPAASSAASGSGRFGSGRVHPRPTGPAALLGKLKYLSESDTIRFDRN